MDEPYNVEPSWLAAWEGDYLTTEACYACGDPVLVMASDTPALCPGCTEAEYQRTLAFRRSKGEKQRHRPMPEDFIAW